MNNGNKLTFKEILENKQYRAILYLGIYFIIFLILILMIRLDSDKNDNAIINEDKTVIVEGFNSIKNKNFNFKYTLIINSDEYIYEGKQYNEKILFTFNNLTYYTKEDVSLVNEDNKYVLSENQYRYFNFFDVNLIEKILDKTILNGENYILSIKDFIKIIDSDINVEEDKNITISLTKPNNIVNKIEIDFTNYAILNDNEEKNVKVLLEYKDFGLVEDFEIK